MVRFLWRCPDCWDRHLKIRRHEHKVFQDSIQEDGDWNVGFSAATVVFDVPDLELDLRHVFILRIILSVLLCSNLPFTFLNSPSMSAVWQTKPTQPYRFKMFLIPLASSTVVLQGTY